MEFTQDQSLQLEVSKVKALVAGYPEGVREDAEWLAGFVRERCSRNLSTLAALCRKLKYEIHETTLSRVLRGKLFDAESQPVMRLKTFSSLIQALRKEDYLANLSGKVPFIETPTWTVFKDYVEFKRAPETVCKFGLVIGPTGSQKSRCAKEFAVRNNHGATAHMETPETPTMGKFITKLGVCYGVSEHYAGEKKRIRINEAVNDKSTIIIDNIQRMYKPRRGWDQPIFNYVQQLQDDTNCTIIFICVPEFEATLAGGMEKGYFEQFEGRVGGKSEFLVLPEFAPPEDVLAIAEAFGLKDAEDYLDELLKIAHQRGRIRILFNALQKAKRVAEASKAALTIVHVRAAMKVKMGGVK
jgi:hypothetical protein